MRKLAAIVCVYTACVVTVVMAVEPLSGYDFRMKLSVTNLTEITGDQADFPILVKLTEANFAFMRADADGLDVRFTAADGQTLLDFDRERHSAADQQAEYWIKLPILSSSAQTDFYMYYGGAASDGAVATNVWKSHYSMVQHMEETAGLFLDSTAFSNNLTNVGGVPTSGGMIGRGISFNGTTAYMQTNTIARPENGGVETWLKWNGNTGARQLAEFLNPDVNVSYRLSINASSNIVSVIHYGGGLVTVTGTTAIEPGVWYHVYDAWGTAQRRLYVNGVLDGSNSSTAIPYSSWWNTMQRFGFQFGGVLDEVRMYSTGRPASWVQAQYASQKDALLQYSTAEDLRPKGTVLCIR